MCSETTDLKCLMVMPWLRQSFTGLSLWRPRFDPRLCQAVWDLWWTELHSV